MELELSLSPPVQNSSKPTKKRYDHGYQESYHGDTRFPLVSWNGCPDEDEDDEHNKNFSNGDYQLDVDGDREGLIGWPPLHSWRKRLIEENHFEGVGFHARVDEREEGSHGNVMNPTTTNNDLLFVKVKMDGVGIARKIDLNLFHSYQMLTNSLIHMFDKYVEIDEDGTSYKLMYQDKDGEWLLAGDLPWEMFIQTVQRIHVIRN